MWEDAMNKMYNPFNFFREWRMMCLSLCYNTFIRTFSPWIRWASYTFIRTCSHTIPWAFPIYTMSILSLLEELHPIRYDELLSTFISILICRSGPMPVETVLPLCSLFHFFPMTRPDNLFFFSNERVPLLRKKAPFFTLCSFSWKFF